MFPTGRDWLQQYGDLSPESKERFAVAETRITGLEVFGLGSGGYIPPGCPAGVYQGLGRFYSSRYSKERLRLHWERASIHFETAVRLDPAKPPPELLKDLGVHLTLIEQILDERVAGGQIATPERTQGSGGAALSRGTQFSRKPPAESFGARRSFRIRMGSL